MKRKVVQRKNCRQQPTEVTTIAFCPEKALVKGRISSNEPDAPGKPEQRIIR